MVLWMGLLLLLLGEVNRLGDESFAVRQVAHARLEMCEEISLPVLLWGANSGDLERKTRSVQLLGRIYHRWEDRGVSLLAWWLFYGPDQYSDPRYRRYLNFNWQTRVESWPLWFHLRLANKAHQWGILDSPIHIGPANQSMLWKPGWINVVRHFAVGLPWP